MIQSFCTQSTCARRRPVRAVWAGALAAWLLLVAVPSRAAAQPNAALEWSAIVQQAIHNQSAPRSAGSSQILHAMVMLAMYDATVAISGGYHPYAADIQASAQSDLRGAIGTAAYLTARARVAPSQIAYLDQQYERFIATVPNARRADAISVGQQAAAAILAARADDGFSNVVLYECSEVPPPIGEFEPDSGCPSGPGSPQPADVKLRQIRPFTFDDPARFRPDGPDPLASRAYAADFKETKDYGRADSTVRTPAQTDLAYFWAENPYVHWNRNLMNLAESARLNLRDTVRFLAFVHTAAADAAIAGFEAKYTYNAWRPRTAIPLADFDDNPLTEGDPSWEPLLKVNHPEYPSGHGFWSMAVVRSVAIFFGTENVPWTLTTSKSAVPQLQKTSRYYDDLTILMRDIGRARIFAGLHYRLAIQHGELTGRRVADHVARHYFRRSNE